MLHLSFVLHQCRRRSSRDYSAGETGLLFPKADRKIYKRISDLNFRFFHFLLLLWWSLQWEDTLGSIKQYPVFLKCLMQPTCIFVHIWGESGTPSFWKYFLLLALSSQNIITPIKCAAFNVAVTSWWTPVADVSVHFWSSGKIEQGSWCSVVQLGSVNLQFKKQNVSAEQFHNSTPFPAPFS